jgi:hypothetical protein
MDWAGWYTIAIVLVGVGIMAFDIMVRPLELTTCTAVASA